VAGGRGWWFVALLGGLWLCGLGESRWISDGLSMDGLPGVVEEFDVEAFDVGAAGSA
jgi:hypothetical protein